MTPRNFAYTMILIHHFLSGKHFFTGIKTANPIKLLYGEGNKTAKISTFHEIAVSMLF